MTATISATQLRTVLPQMPKSVADEAAVAITAVAGRFGITTTLRLAHFVVQMLHESRGFMSMVENLNYSADMLLHIWPRRFTPETARLYGRIDGVHAANPQMIANVAYANRMGNGSIESGDGWRYRARGPGQLTGRENYRLCGLALGMDLVNFPDQIAQITAGCLAFGWFWDTHSLNLRADQNDLTRVRLAVNGGTLGLDDCQHLLDAVLHAMAVPA